MQQWNNLLIKHHKNLSGNALSISLSLSKCVARQQKINSNWQKRAKNVYCFTRQICKMWSVGEFFSFKLHLLPFELSTAEFFSTLRKFCLFFSSNLFFLIPRDFFLGCVCVCDQILFWNGTKKIHMFSIFFIRTKKEATRGLEMLVKKHTHTHLMWQNDGYCVC